MLLPRFADTAIHRLAGLDPFPQPQVIPLRYPVMLMHGFGMVAGLRRGGHLHQEAMNLRLHGVRAYAPNVAPYNTVRVRAELWKNRLDTILQETRAEKINLIAHSMGGLDARYLISVLQQHESVASLTTVSTPHHGSPIAHFLLERPERIQGWVNDLCNWLGTAAFPDCSADFLTTVHELTEAYMRETFNLEVPDHPSVRYWSYAGAAGKGTDVPLNPFMIPFNAIIFNREGINDGFVSVESARWGEFLGVIDADHARQIGVVTTRGGSFRSRDFYRSIVVKLAEEGL